jgi:hypothetical protein
LRIRRDGASRGEAVVVACVVDDSRGGVVGEHWQLLREHALNASSVSTRSPDGCLATPLDPRPARDDHAR